MAAGNVATYEGARELVAAGADGIKVGVGAVSIFTTQFVTGCGARTLEELWKNAWFVRITSAAWGESQPHAPLRSRLQTRVYPHPARRLLV